MPDTNAAWADVEDFIRRGMYEDAGLLVAQIVREIDEDINPDQVEEFVDAIHGEII